jgi:cell division protein FtsZ
LKPEIEDELIITVIATGFDSAYFQETGGDVEETEAADQNVSDETVSSVDMNLDHSESAAIFAEENNENMWSHSVEQDDESDTPAFLRRRKKKNKKTEE